MIPDNTIAIGFDASDDCTFTSFGFTTIDGFGGEHRVFIPNATIEFGELTDAGVTATITAHPAPYVPTAEDRREDLLEEVAQAILQSDYDEPVDMCEMHRLVQDNYMANAEAVLSLFEAKGVALADLDLKLAELVDLHAEKEELRQKVQDLLAEVRSLETYITQLMEPEHKPYSYPCLSVNVEPVAYSPEQIKLLHGALTRNREQWSTRP